MALGHYLELWFESRSDSEATQSPGLILRQAQRKDNDLVLGCLALSLLLVHCTRSVTAIHHGLAFFHGKLRRETKGNL